jgi:WD40 repeat protein
VCLRTIEEDRRLGPVALSHDLVQLASNSYEALGIWDTDNGMRMQRLEGYTERISSVIFSHNSAQLAAALNDNTIKIWDASSGACLNTFKHYSFNVTSMAFSHDLSQLASASQDDTIKIWDASSGMCLQTLSVDKTLFGLSFSPSSSYLYTDIGTIVIQRSEVSGTGDSAEPERPIYIGTGLSADSIWIKHGSNNVLWIPSEYRPLCSSACESMVGIGDGSGRVWICSVNL